MERGENARLLLFDGNALVHRAFHALPALTVSRTGEVVNAVYGFASTLLKILHDLKPTHWAIAFDRPAPTFRQELFEEYKAQRPKAPPELVSQIKRAHQLAEAFHIPIFELDGVVVLIRQNLHSSNCYEADLLRFDDDTSHVGREKPGANILGHCLDVRV